MPASPEPGAPPSASTTAYATGVAITVLAILSQYFVPDAIPATRVVYGNLVGDLLVAYGIPVAAFSILVGAGPLRRWRSRMRLATWQGLRWYGLLSVLGLFVTLVLAVIFLAVDPSALQALKSTPPPLVAAAGDPWFFVGLSFAIGAIEETIFRGWIFGFWRGRPGSWLVPATWTSVLFAGLHLYYGSTYGIASILVFPSLFLVGFAFAATYRLSGGNLLVPAVLHGAFDASAFLTIISVEWGALFRYLPVLVGVLIGIFCLSNPGPDPPEDLDWPGPVALAADTRPSDSDS
ncbi:MAG TPA: type II CAAX endopeptidase family protein [Thermoplasmata archaeon]|nr:type II CAAX endopeptidase family protein [Thermoplasmata archaeon]